MREKRKEATCSYVILKLISEHCVTTSLMTSTIYLDWMNKVNYIPICIGAAGWEGLTVGVTSADGWTAIGETSWPVG